MRYILICVVLISTASQCSFAGEQVRYRVQVENTWSSTTHPNAFHELAHFSWVGGATHREQHSLWEVNQLASPGMVQMAESGATTILVDEAAKAIDQGLVYSIIDQPHWFCPDEIQLSQCGPMTFEVDVDSDFPELSLVTMLGPSPDWFVGVSGLPLRDEDGWINETEHTLFPYDGGTRSNNVVQMAGPKNDPPEPITHITKETGQIITDQSLGSLTLTRIVECDLDGDFACTSTDIDLLTQSFGDVSFDLDASGSTDEEDRRYWVEQLMGTSFGDTNLDQDVDFADFVALALNYGDDSAGWAGGDFNGSGTTDFPDFLLLAQNFGSSTVSSVANVPEPSTFVPLFLAGMLLALAASRAGPALRGVTFPVAFGKWYANTPIQTRHS